MTDSKLLDYRKFLKDELHLRKMKNSKYSLRAYARDLGISTSRLSEIFAGKSGLSYEKAAQISDILNFSEKDRHLFLDLVESDHARSSMARRMAKARVSERLTKFGSSLFRVGPAKNIKKHKHLEISSDSFFHSYNQKLCFLQDLRSCYSLQSLRL